MCFVPISHRDVVSSGIFFIIFISFKAVGKVTRLIKASHGNNLKATTNLENVWHIFVIRSANRDKLQQYLQENGIQTSIHYPIPPHKQNAYMEWSHYILPVTEKIHREVLSLPISPVINIGELSFIADKINKSF